MTLSEQNDEEALSIFSIDFRQQSEIFIVASFQQVALLTEGVVFEKDYTLEVELRNTDGEVDTTMNVFVSLIV